MDRSQPLNKFTQFMKLKFLRKMALNYSSTKLFKFMRGEKICRAERTAQKSISIKKEMVIVKLFRYY